jgi:hypothetical protein
LILERSKKSGALLGTDSDWIEDHAPCDVVEVSNFEHSGIDHIGVITDEGPFDPAKVSLADSLATAVGATVTFYFPIDGDSPESHLNTTDDYLDELAALCDAPAEKQIVESGTNDAIELAANESDVLIVSGVQHGLMDRLFGGSSDPVTAGTEHSTFVVYRANRPRPLRDLLERRLF